jgi:hypothetical protein
VCCGKAEGVTGQGLSHTDNGSSLRTRRASTMREVSEMKDEETTHSQVVELGLLIRRVSRVK